MTTKSFDGRDFGERLLASVKDYFARGIAPAAARIEALERRVAELEARPQALAYGGTWSAGQESKKGLFYTDRGQVWFAQETTRDRPGETNAWTLAVRRGQDLR